MERPEPPDDTFVPGPPEPKGEIEDGERPPPGTHDQLDPAPDPPGKASSLGTSPLTWAIAAAVVVVVVLLIVFG